MLHFWNDMPLEAQLAILALVGAFVGGQVNRGIYRLAWTPRAIGPWSAAAANLPARPFWTRLPIVGWLTIRSESPVHGRGFWIRPLLIELALTVIYPWLYRWELQGGLLPAGAWQLADIETLQAAFLVHATLLPLLVVATFIDFDEQTIPDTITLPGAILGLLLAATAPAGGLPIVLRTPPTWTFRIAPLELNSPLAWDESLDGPRGLLIGLSCFAAWCVAIVPRLWTTRRGWRRAFVYLGASMVRSGWIPRLAVVFCIAAGVITAGWWSGGWHWHSLLSSLVGLAFGGGLVWLIRIGASAALGEEAMGFGDVTLMSMIGAFLGWQSSLLVFFLAPAAALFVSVAQWLLTRRRDIAFGPYLCVGAIGVVVSWGRLWAGWGAGFFALGWLVPAALLVCMALMAILLFIWGQIKRRLFAN